MSEGLGPGSTFAGCRVEAVAGRGGMGVVWRATQLALERPVALKVIAPELAADESFRGRFQRESHLAASIDHPNVIPVYEAGELDGRLYLIMRWVDGTDLRTLLSSSGRVSPGRAVKLLRPVASALAAAHRRGLVHRDIKPANVMIARGGDEDEDHVYLTDFGIARRTDGESMTRTGMFVGTIDYMAPERFEGGKGDAASDIYSCGCMLFELLTGHVPFERPTDVSKIFAHVSDPIPSAREEVEGVPEQLDVIIARAMAKRPEDRFGSAGELAVALEQGLHELDTAERAAAAPKAGPEVAEVRAPTAVSKMIEPPAVRQPVVGETGPTAGITGPTAPSPTGPTAPSKTAPTAPSPSAQTAGVTEPNAAVSEPPAPSDTTPTAPSPTAPKRRGDLPPLTRPRRRSPILWAAPIALLAVAGVLIAVLAGGSSHQSNGPAAAGQSRGTPPAQIKIQGSGLTEGRTILLSSQPGSIATGSRNIWISLPGGGRLVRFNPLTGRRRIFTASGGPAAIAPGFSALWVAEAGSRSLAQFNGDSGARVALTKLEDTPTAVAADPSDSSAWVADASGTITHVALGGAVIGAPARIVSPATSIAWGEGWLWAANGADNGLVRVSLGTDGASTAYATGPRPVAVAVDQGVWTAHADGHVSRFDPRPDKLRVNADIALPAELDSIAATEKSPFVWAISKSARTLYQISNTSKPMVTGTVQFSSLPVALAAGPRSVWVATQDDRVVQILY